MMWQQMPEQEQFARFDALVTRLAQANKGFSNDEVSADIEAALDKIED